MAVIYPGTMAELGAELKALRGLEAVFEYFSLVNSTPKFFKDFINAEYDNTVQAEDIQETRTKLNFIDSIVPTLSGVHGDRKSDFDTNFLFVYLSGLLAAPQIDQGSAFIWEYDQTLLGTGEIRIFRRGGILGLLFNDMVANSQTVLENIITPGALVAKPANVGIVAESGVTFQDHALPGVLTFVCLDDTVGTVTFSVQNILNAPLVDEKKTIDADNVLTVGQPFEDGPTGTNITISLAAIVVTGDDGSMFTTAPVVSTPSEVDSDKGKHYIEVERKSGTGGNPDFTISWFKNANLAAENLVASLDVVGVTGTVGIVLNANSSSITDTFNKANAAIKLPVVGNKDSDIIFNIGSPRIGDTLTKTIANGFEGNFQTKLATRYQFSLPKAVSGSEIISDALAASVPMT